MMMTKNSLLLVSFLLAVSVPPSNASSMKFSLADLSCDGVFEASSVAAECNGDCEAGDTVTVTGNVVASGTFDANAKVLLEPCVTVLYINVHCFGAEDTGSVCDWIDNDDGDDCGTAGSYTLSNAIKIPEEAKKLKRYGSLVSLKVKATIGSSGDACTSAASASYAMVMSSMAGLAGLIGAATFVRRRRRIAVADEKKASLLEMPDVHSGTTFV